MICDPLRSSGIQEQEQDSGTRKEARASKLKRCVLTRCGQLLALPYRRATAVSGEDRRIMLSSCHDAKRRSEVR